MRSARTRLSLEQVLALGPFRGAESSGGADDGGKGNEGAGGTGGQNDGGGKGGAGGTGKSDDDTDDPAELKRKLANRVEQATRQDAEIRRLKEIEREADELRTKQEEQDRKGRSDLENATKDVERLTKQNESLLATVKRLTLENTFLQIKDVDWHDPEDALRLVDLSSVEFDGEGNVKDPGSLKKAAKDLAKAKPHLVKKSTDVGPGVPQGAPTGTAPAGGTNNTGKATEDTLRKKYRIRT